MATVVSINVGLPRDVEWQGKTVRTSVWKRPVEGRVMARRLNIDGDGQGDLAGHGGEHRAVMVYQLDSYRYWARYLQRDDLEHGHFGENLTVEGLGDDEVFIGDRYRIGGAVFEVSQPRVTCYRVSIRMNNPQMAALLVSHKRPGFYFRVVEEGEIGAGDEIVKISDGLERVTVAEMDALLYLPGHPRDRLEHALRIPALSDGWKRSLEALLQSNEHDGNAGLAGSSVPPPAWRGFRALRVARVERESADVLSFVFEAEDSRPLPSPLRGQFVAFKVAVEPGSVPLLRTYSVLGQRGAGTYRISVKRGVGPGSQYFHDRIRAGHLLQVSAPRGSFTLVKNAGPVVLLSAGIGVTPVLSMLHALAAEENEAGREVWWCYGARDGREHPFAEEVRGLLKALPQSHSLITYSRPEEGDQLGKGYDAKGRLSIELLQQHNVPRAAEFHLCGPATFLDEIATALRLWGVDASCIHTENFGAAPALTPGIVSTPVRTPHKPAGDTGNGPRVSFTRSGLSVSWNAHFGSLLEFA